MTAAIPTTHVAGDGFADVSAAPKGAIAKLQRVATDSAILARRSLSHIRREPEQLIDVTIQPIMFVLLFTYVFGSAINVPGGTYKDFLMAGIFAQTLLFTAVGTAVALADDMHKGVIDRFRVLPIARSAVLLGRSVADLATSIIGLTIMVLTALLVGWRTQDGMVQTFAGFLLLLFFSYAVGWAGIWVGVSVRNSETAQQGAFIVLFPMTFISNAFVPTAGMPTVLRVIAEWNPFSAVVAALRDLFGNPTGPPSDAWPLQHPVEATLIWSVLILVLCVPLAVRTYRRSTAR